MSSMIDELVDYQPSTPSEGSGGNGNGNHAAGPSGSSLPSPAAAAEGEAGTRRGLAQWMRDRSMKVKVLVAPVVAAVLVVVVGAIGLSATSSVQSHANHLYDDVTVAMHHLEVMQHELGRAHIFVVEHILESDTAEWDDREAEFALSMSIVHEEFAEYLEADLDRDAALVDSIEPGLAEIEVQFPKLVELSRAEDPGTNAYYNDVVDNSFDVVADAVEALIDGAQHDGELAAEAGQTEVGAARQRILFAGLFCVALAIGLALLVARSITTRLGATVDALDLVAAGNLSQLVTVDSVDEVGRMGTALNAALRRFRAAVASIGDNAQTLASSSEMLSTVSTQLSESAEETSAQATVVAAAAEQVSANVETVATGSEEMSASIKEIAQNATQASSVANSGVGMAEETNAAVSKLAQSSQEIGEIVSTITSIAEQTNLLALNATIEAARAGEAGKGFAIVANEVKELAKETAAATEEISSRIETIQSDSRESVEAIGQIVELIGRINDAQTTIASAVEEQTATTNEIGRNVGEAASGAGEIARNVSSVATAAQSTAAGAEQTQQSAGDLARLSAQLEELISQFQL